MLLYASLVLGVAETALASPEADRFAALLDEARQSDEPAVALARLIDAATLVDWLDPVAVVEHWSEAAAASDSRLVADLATYFALRTAWESADRATSDALEDSLAFVDSWRVIGPFANDGMAGLSTAWGPETDGVSPEAGYDGKSQRVEWREVVGDTETGYVELSALFHPNVNAALYAATEIEIERAGDYTLAMAVDGAYRVWVDGVPLAEQPEHLGGFFMRDEVDVELTRGTHQIVVKLAGIDSILGLHLRMLDARGNSVAVEARPATQSIALAGASEWPRPRSLADSFAPLLAGSDASALASAASVVCTLAPEDPDQPWAPFIDAALGLDPTAEDLVRMAACLDEHWRRVDLLARAHRQAPHDDFITLAYIEARLEEMGQDAVDEVAALVRAMIEAGDAPAAAFDVRARLEDDAGLYYTAFETACALRERYPSSRAALSSCQRFALRINRFDIAAALDVELARLDAGSLSRWESLFSSLRARGEATTSAVDAMLTRWPVWPAVFGAAARDARARDDFASAQSYLAAGLTLCPSCTELLDARARLHVELGDHEAAAADFATMLEIEPQDAYAREYLTHLQDEDDRFFDEFRVADAQIEAMRIGADAPADMPFTWLVDQNMVHVHPNGLATTWVQQAIEAHTQAGADAIRSFGVTFTPDAEQVEIIGARVLRPDGTVRAVFDTAEYGSNSGPAAMYFDVRQRGVYLPTVEPGDIVVFEYTVEDVAYRNIFDDYFGEMWTFQSSEPRALVRYGLRVPASREVFVGGDDRALGSWHTEARDGDSLMIFEARDVPPVRLESASPGPSETYAHISVSTYGDWNDLADWYWQLVDQQLVLTPEIEQTVAELTAGLETTRQKVAAIHNWVVRNTRYVGLEFGIHGYKPYRTSECFARRFGDCKDTASLIKVMLEAAGIDARLVLVRTRDQGRVGEFPPSLAVFNHVIAWVPELDLYLDGTAGFSGSGELPTLDQGASALIVDDGNGGNFHEIPWLAADSSQSRVRVDVDLGGEQATATGEIVMSGAFAPSMRRRFEAAELRDERFRDFFANEISGVEVVSTRFGDLGDIEVPVEITFELQGGDWARTQGDDLVMQLFTTDSDLLEAFAGASTRTTNLDASFPFVLDETYTIRVAEGLAPLELPAPVELTSDFGELRTSVSFDDGVLRTGFVFSLTATLITVEQYPEFRAFMQTVDQELSRIVRFAPESR